jgi:hypothetical protein
VSHPWDLTDEQFEAVRALQRGAPAPYAHDHVWTFLLAMGLVWIDAQQRPPEVRLTPIGHNYDAS